MVENPNNPLPKQQNDAEENGMDMGDDIEMEDEDNMENEEDLCSDSEEFASIDNQLDMLNTVLDKLEQKNDVILAELTTLLNENREIRKQLQECRLDETTDKQEQQ